MMIEKKILLQKQKQYEKECIALRRRFHQIPEPGLEERETTALIASLLEEHGIKSYPLEPTGLVAYLGAKEGYTVALRADIDGLLVEEETGAEYASRYPGRMHACGHDGHIAGLLGAAFLLKELEGELSVRVKLIFQPSEENTLGAKKVIAQGVLEDVDEIFGLHLFSDMELGQYSVEAGPRMAQTDRFSIVFHGKGGHAGKPHQCVDATVMAAEFVLGLQTAVSRETNPLKPAVVTVGSFHSGSQYNVISGEAVVEGTCRSFHEDVAARLKTSIEERAKHIAACYGGKAEITYDFGSHPPVINEKNLSESIKKEAQMLLGYEQAQVEPMMLGEDFSWYQKKVPGVFAFVGCHNPDQKECFPNHHPCFDIDERALKDAVLLHLSAVLSAQSRVEEERSFLKEKSKGKRE
ncbi:MAG: M20 family metallopeptidase [Eubacteriales bacterium]|nr:M20 family metallopeptidase [Eubacteriales bacterium]